MKKQIGRGVIGRRARVVDYCGEWIVAGVAPGAFVLRKPSTGRVIRAPRELVEFVRGNYEVKAP